MDNDDLDYDKQYQEHTKNYFGTCYICGEHVPIRELINIEYNKKQWWICECCHSAYWHGGYSPIQIGQSLEETEKKRDEERKDGYLLELKDIKRQIKKKITLEEMADFYYWLYKEGSKIVDRLI